MRLPWVPEGLGSECCWACSGGLETAEEGRSGDNLAATRCNPLLPPSPPEQRGEEQRGSRRFVEEEQRGSQRVNKEDRSSHHCLTEDEGSIAPQRQLKEERRTGQSIAGDELLINPQKDQEEKSNCEGEVVQVEARSDSNCSLLSPLPVLSGQIFLSQDPAGKGNLCKDPPGQISPGQITASASCGECQITISGGSAPSKAPTKASDAMPFHDNVYHPITSESCGQSVTSCPPLVKIAQKPMATQVPPPMAFGFRCRQECMDWRKLGAIDLDRVVTEQDTTVLQENIKSITFCSVACERCPHCHNPLDPVVVKLVRLAQYIIEYLLHSQQYLTSNVQALEETVLIVRGESEQLKSDLCKQAKEVKTLKEECRRRKKIISTQQLMIQNNPANCHKCQFCDKAFLDSTFLQNHIQRRHAEEAEIENQKKKQVGELLQEINKLKEELQAGKSELQTEKCASETKLAKELENQAKKEEELLKMFEQWKSEERDKHVDEMCKVKEMFVDKFTEMTEEKSSLEKQVEELQVNQVNLQEVLTQTEVRLSEHELAKANSPSIEDLKERLDNQENMWSSKMVCAVQDHEDEKNKLLAQLEQLKLSVAEEKETTNICYNKEIEELRQKIKELEEQIALYKEEIQDMSTKALQNKIPVPDPAPLLPSPVEDGPPDDILVPTAITKPRKEPAASETSLPECSAPGILKWPIRTYKLEPIEELSDEDQEKEKDNFEEALGASKQQLVNALRNNPCLTKELRAILEQGLNEKLYSLGIQSTARAIPTDHLSRVLNSLESNREEKEKQEPTIQKIRLTLERQVTNTVKKSLSSNRLPCHNPGLSGEGKQSMAQECAAPVHQSKPKTAKQPTKDTCLLNSKTPPFTSDEEEDLKRQTVLRSYNVQPSRPHNQPYNRGKTDSQTASGQSDADSGGTESDGISPVQPQDVVRKETVLLSYKIQQNKKGKTCYKRSNITTTVSGPSDTDSDGSELEEIKTRVLQEVPKKGSGVQPHKTPQGKQLKSCQKRSKTPEPTLTEPSDSDSGANETLFHAPACQNLPKKSRSPGKGHPTQDACLQYSKAICSRGLDKKNAGIDITKAFLKKDALREVKFSQCNVDEGNSSPSEPDESTHMKVNMKKNEVKICENKNAWVPLKLSNEEMRDLQSSNTIVSSLSEWSDCSDV